MDWAKQRRRKADAKCHLRLDLQSFLPACAIIEEASHHDDTRAQQLCAALKDCEIALFDKAYVNFEHLYVLACRGVFRGTRAKDNMSFRVVKKLIRKPAGKILQDEGAMKWRIGRSPPFTTSPQFPATLPGSSAREAAVMRPVPLRPKRWGSYMASIFAGGAVTWPGATTRARYWRL